jgi:deoxyribonuclease V
MMACLDVHYGENSACAAAVLFRDWTDAVPGDEKVVEVFGVQPYAPGEFFRRELPCLMAVLRELPPLTTIVIDGYVWLDGMSQRGLGAHLYEALGQSVPVVGVAKTRFQGAGHACEVLRGRSQRPLFVTAAGIAATVAAEHLRSMHGEHRRPTLLARVDRLCRTTTC